MADIFFNLGPAPACEFDAHASCFQYGGQQAEKSEEYSKKTYERDIDSDTCKNLCGLRFSYFRYPNCPTQRRPFSQNTGPTKSSKQNMQAPFAGPKISKNTLTIYQNASNLLFCSYLAATLAPAFSLLHNMLCQQKGKNAGGKQFLITLVCIQKLSYISNFYNLKVTF